VLRRALSPGSTFLPNGSVAANPKNWWPTSSLCISRTQLIARLREAKFSYEDRGKRAEIYKKKGSTTRVDVMLRDLLPENYVRVVLLQAGLTESEVGEFKKAAIKVEC